MEAPDAESHAVDIDAEVARYVAQRGFVASAWTGALILTFSYAQLYLALLAHIYGTRTAYVFGILSAILGGVMFLRSRRLWQEVGGEVGRRSMTGALLVAGAGGFFWLLFALLLVLMLLGVPIM